MLKSSAQSKTFKIDVSTFSQLLVYAVQFALGRSRSIQAPYFVNLVVQRYGNILEHGDRTFLVNKIKEQKSKDSLVSQSSDWNNTLRILEGLNDD